MKVYIGPYYHWFQPYTWAKRWTRWWCGFGAGTHADDFDIEEYEELEDWMRKRFRWLNRLQGWIGSFYKRKVQVCVDYYDIWNAADGTLAPIILPTLKLLREKKQGAPHVDDEDVPEHLRSTAAPALTDAQANMGGTDDNWHFRWQWVLDEMIWAMEQVADDSADDQFFHPVFNRQAYQEWQARKQHGLTLFGKYFEGLWD